MVGSRFHTTNRNQFDDMDTKKMNNRGKYRSMTTSVFNSVLWSDSKLVVCVSADLDTEEDRTEHRCDRHVK
mgnify:CR=1 FL=1